MKGAMRKPVLLAVPVLLAILGAAAANEFAAPAISAVPVPGDPPLTLRFSVSNRGWLLPIRNLDFTCVPDQVVGRDAKGAPFPLNVNIDLGPQDSFQYTCPIQGPHLPDRVDRIEAHIELSYTRLGQRSEAHSAELIWDSQSKVWMAAGG